MNRKALVLDTETTGFSAIHDRIVEIAIIGVTPWTGAIGPIFHHIVNPQRHIPAETTRIHGISDSQVEGKPSFSDIAGSVSSLISGSTLVIHNSNFDISMLNAEFGRSNLNLIGDLNVEIVDSIELAKDVFPLLPGYTLDAICDHVGVSRAERTTHGALVDVTLLASTLPEIAKKYEEWQSLFEPSCAPQVTAFCEGLEGLAVPLLNEDISDESIAHSLGAVVTVDRWLEKTNEKLTSLATTVLAEPGWLCKHMFARFRAQEVFSYKDAATALLAGTDLRAFEKQSYVYRVSPSLDKAIQAELANILAVLDWPTVTTSVDCLVRTMVVVRSLRRNMEKRREQLRKHFLQLALEGTTSDLVSVVESARRTTDYRAALSELAGGADLNPYAKLHTRLSVGTRSTKACETLFD